MPHCLKPNTYTRFGINKNAYESLIICTFYTCNIYVVKYYLRRVCRVHNTILIPILQISIYNAVHNIIYICIIN